MLHTTSLLAYHVLRALGSPTYGRVAAASFRVSL